MVQGAGGYERKWNRRCGIPLSSWLGVNTKWVRHKYVRCFNVDARGRSDYHSLPNIACISLTFRVT